ncbi:DUF11 domain-containing protein [Mycetocola miduiensis]|uniref:Conserved repeat domain-containing protein n=1 Tax=Mycetocola miduiensis TaxID=995034 RepID=A0A1I5B3J3_9MICO|nr:DUF11 domain-containing protein [Mycetocola miduiensis]SFN69252.1 conserved repeat domain-containing protein [Mycetocola miduiensis]
MMRNRAAALAAVILFLVLSGSGISHAYWSTHATSRANVQAASLADNCPTVRGVPTGSGPCLVAVTTLTNVTSPGTPPRVGDTLEYTTTVTNNGGAPSGLTRLSGTIPDGLTFEAGSLGTTGASQSDAAGDDHAEYLASSGTFTARLGDGATATTGGAIAPESRATFTLRSIVNAHSTAEKIISYAQATVTYIDTRAPQWTVNFLLVPVVSTIQDSTDLATTQVVASPWVTPGGSNGPRWTITVTNNGLSNDGAVVRVVVPTGLANPSFSGPNSCPAVTGMAQTFDCDAGTLSAGASKSIIFQGTVPSTYSGDPLLSVTATVRGSIYDHEPANNTSTGTVTVVYPVNTPAGGR